MFGRKKTPTMNATAVMPLTETNLKVLKAMQMRHIDNIPEGATHVAFLEDGDACFLNHFEAPRVPGSILPKFANMTMVTYYENIPIEFED